MKVDFFRGPTQRRRVQQQVEGPVNLEAIDRALGRFLDDQAAPAKLAPTTTRSKSEGMLAFFMKRCASET